MRSWTLEDSTTSFLWKEVLESSEASKAKVVNGR
jgi:hypothetical protein